MNRWRMTALAVMLGVVATGPSVAQQAAPRTLAQGPHGIFYIAINVSDFEKSKAFYTQVIGLKEIVQPQRAGAAFIPTDSDSASLSFDGQTGDQHIVLQHDKKRTKPLDLGDGFIRFTLKVDDLKAVVARGKTAGYEVFQDLGNIVRFHDPDGYIVQILQIDSGVAPPAKK